MVKITLRNIKQDSTFKQAVIDVASGLCVVDDGPEMETRLLATTMDFSHPLLTQSILSPSGAEYVYEYDDFDGLLDATKFIYATLIQVHNPCDCKFRITPSVNFIRLKKQYQIPFSIDCKKQASELITIQQINSMISRFHDFDFQYQDSIVLDKTLAFKDFPPAVDGDLIYQTNPELARFCKQVDAIHKFELRYINRFIGFGVFARKDMVEGEWITHYCGVKILHGDLGGAYVFGKNQDAFNLRIDAMHSGNISRFVNHAPIHCNEQATSSSEVLESNIIPEIHSLYGNDIIIYTAKRNISKGEQLLVDYGVNYFFNKEGMYSIKHNGNIMGPKNKMIKESRKQKQHTLRLMSRYDIKQAKWLLIRKPLIVMTVTLLFAFFLTRS